MLAIEPNGCEFSIVVCMQQSLGKSAGSEKGPSALALFIYDAAPTHPLSSSPPIMIFATDLSPRGLATVSYDTPENASILFYSPNGGVSII